MNKLIIALSVTAWLGCGVVGAGFWNADFRGSFSDLYQDPYEAKSGLSKSLILTPFGPFYMVMSYFLSGFGYYGWTLASDPLPCIEKDDFSKQLWCKN